MLARDLREKPWTPRQVYKAVISLDEMHEACEKLLKNAEEKPENDLQGGGGWMTAGSGCEYCGCAVAVVTDLFTVSGKRLKLTIWDTAGQERFFD